MHQGKKTVTRVRAPMGSLSSSSPLEHVCIDYRVREDLSIYSLSLTISHDSLKLTLQEICPDGQRLMIILFNDYIPRFGYPGKLHHDQGREFGNDLFRNLRQLVGVCHTRTSPYHPQWNPAERFNRTLLQMLCKMAEKEKAKWKDPRLYMPTFVLVMNQLGLLQSTCCMEDTLASLLT